MYKILSLKLAAAILLLPTSNMWSPASAESFELSDNSPIYCPTGLNDPRLAKDPSYVPGTASYAKDLAHRYSHELYRFAKKLCEQEKYKKALPIILLAMENHKDDTITFDRFDKVYVNICLGIASQESGVTAEKYYEKALVTCDNYIKKGLLPDNYYLLKTKALIGLGRKEEAILSCQTAYNFAFARHDKTDEPSAYLRQLTGLSEPTAVFNNRNHSEIKKETLSLANRKIAPTQKEIEEILGITFDAAHSNYCEKNLIGGDGLYDDVSLRLPFKAEEDTSLTLVMRKESAGITEAMVRQWFAHSVPTESDGGGPKSLVFKQPTGDTNFAFSTFAPKLAYQWSFHWHKASELAHMPEQVETNRPIKQESFDDLFAKGKYKEALRRIKTEIVAETPADGYTSAEFRDRIRAQLIKSYEFQRKPGIVAYLKVASFQELVMMLSWIEYENRSDFYTIKEYLAEKYIIGGELDEDFKGTLLICGFQKNRIALIFEETEAAKEFLKSLHIKLPFKKFTTKTFHSSTSTGLLLDKIADQQNLLEQKRNLEARSGF